MDEQTARAWMKAFSIWMVLNGVMLIPVGLFTAIFASLDPIVPIIFNVVIGVFYVFAGVVSLLLGMGIWNYKPWSRITMIVLGWLGVLWVLLLLLLALVGGVLSSVAPEFAEAGPALSVLLAFFAALFGIVVGVHLWLFQFNSTVASLFVLPQSEFKLTVDAKNVPELVKGWSIVTWTSALMFMLFSVFFFVGGPAIAGIMLDPRLALIVFALIGVLLLCVSLLLHFLAIGLWRGYDGARKASVVFAWILTIGGAIITIFGVFAVVMVFVGNLVLVSKIPDMVQTILAGLYYIALGLVQRWFFRREDVRAYFASEKVTVATTVLRVPVVATTATPAASKPVVKKAKKVVKKPVKKAKK